MAIIPATRYVGKITAPDANYPQGSCRNITVPGDGTGTPAEQAWLNDIWGVLQLLLEDSNITPSGNPDTVLASDYSDALHAIFGNSTAFEDSGVGGANDYRLTLISGASTPVLSDGDILIFEPATTNTASSTINVDGLGDKVVRLFGTTIGPNVLVAGVQTTVRYNLPDDKFDIMNRPADMIFVQEETSGVSGGTATTSWGTRQLNVKKIDDAQQATLSSGQITIPAGVYDLVSGFAVAKEVDGHQCRLYDTTAASAIQMGTSERADSGEVISNHSTLPPTRFTLSVSSTLVLSHRSDLATAGDGWGNAAGFDTEVYASLHLRRIG